MTTKTPHEETEALDQFIRKNEFPKQYPHLVTPPQFEWIFKNRSKNGFDSAFKMIGRKPFVHIPTFHDCLLKQ